MSAIESAYDGDLQFAWYGPFVHLLIGDGPMAKRLREEYLREKKLEDSHHLDPTEFEQFNEWLVSFDGFIKSSL